MQKLLHEFCQREFPSDYLVARLRSRRAFIRTVPEELDENGYTAIEASDEREKAVEERRWLFGQLNTEQRKNLAPLFLYFELEVLVQCLRCLEAGQTIFIDGLLEKSLLAGSVKQVLITSNGMTDVLAGLERVFNEAHVPVSGLIGSYDEGGIRNCEKMMRTTFLSQVCRRCPHGEILEFFRDIVDIRNTMTVAKYLHWQISSTPDLIAGGRFECRIVRKNVNEGMLIRMISHFAGGTTVSEELKNPIRLEPVLFYGMLKKMTRSRRVSGPVTAVVEYLWQWHMYGKRNPGRVNVLR